MKKKELLKMVPVDLPDRNYAKVFTVCRTKVLMVILPEWIICKGYSEQVGIAHFTWKTGFLTYYPKIGLWTREGLECVECNTRFYNGNLDERSRERIRNFIGYRELYGIYYYESIIRYKKRDKALDRKQLRIDRYMNETIPNLPRNFKQKCMKMKGKKKKIHITLFQEQSDGVVERIFIADNDITEICRGYKKTIAGKWEKWYYGECWHRYGIKQKFWDRKGQATYKGNLIQPTYIFDNLEELNMTPAQRSCLRIMSGVDDMGWLLTRLDYTPEIEWLIKAGLKRIVKEARDAKSVAKRVKKLSKRQREILREYNGGIYALEMLEESPKITDANIQEFCKIKSEFKARDILEIVEREEFNVNHLFTLWKKTGGIKNETIQKYKDYIQMAQQQGHDIHEEIIYRNKRWRHFHDVYVQERNRQREEENKKKNKAINEKWAGISRDYERNMKLFEWETDGYKIIVPESAEKINEEGRLQHHCVGANDIYKTNMAIRKSFIVFLRRTEKEEEPYYTIETDGRRVIQAYAAYDRKPDAEIVQKILADWMKQVRKRVEEKEWKDR